MLFNIFIYCVKNHLLIIFKYNFKKIIPNSVRQNVYVVCFHIFVFYQF
ncbi:conserved hypothetical protein [Finegoldia magna ATCC 29328]|uniref:Uncharacterized protein n=1 Tax=Finegoldia magna (strain ATCC 29328 / DSM 20472 / WAL 2508) TaxID=334413 RepID=B0S0X7_FINM2|nr:conserved hypothetical protein [Finegoldia magna ATCC 29328]